MLASALCLRLALAAWSASLPSTHELATGGADPSEPLPLVVALHGRGSSSDSITRTLRSIGLPARVVALDGPRASGLGRAWFHTRLTTRDVAGLERALATEADRVAGTVTRVEATRPTCGRTIVVGVSQGGAVGLAYAARHGEHTATVVQMSSWTPPSLRPGTDVTVSVMHGTADRRIPYRRVSRMVDDLRATGTQVDLRTFDGDGHRPSSAGRQALRRAVATAVQAELASEDCRSRRAGALSQSRVSPRASRDAD